MKSLRISPLLIALLGSSLFFLGCDDESEAEVVDTTPIVTPLQMPIAHRNDAEPPSDALLIEVKAAMIRVNHQDVLPMDNGRVAEGEYVNNSLTKVFQAVELAPAHTAARIHFDAAVNWGPIAQILSTLERSNIHRAYFGVRAGPNLEVKYLEIARFDAIPASEERNRVATDTEGQRQWDEVAGLWDVILEGCQRANSIDCDTKPRDIKVGGDVHMTLFARGTHLKVEFRRLAMEGEAVEEGEQPSSLDYVRMLEALGEGEDEPPPPPPSRYAAFSWQSRAATAEESSISAAMNPLCGALPCRAALVSEKITQAGIVISFLGAVYPNGTPPMDLEIVVPDR